MRLDPTLRYLRTYKRLIRRRQDAGLRLFEDAIAPLLHAWTPQAKLLLASRFRMHVLRGARTGLYELHLQHDLLLLFDVREPEGYIVLLDLVSHDEL